MEVLKVTVSAPVVSFRRPLDHNFQRTLPMPPPTTLLGVVGAALGLSDRELWAKESPAFQLKVAVLQQPSDKTGKESAKAKDMWTVLKITTSREGKSGRVMVRSPYFRELLFFSHFTLIYGGPLDLLYELRDAFRDPVYPLSLGREDELISLEEIEIVDAPRGKPLFQGTVIPGDIKKLTINLSLKEGIRFEPPLVEKLPLSFNVDRKRIRSPSQRISLTFIPYSSEIEVPDVRPTFSIKGRNFTWMNSLESQMSCS